VLIGPQVQRLVKISMRFVIFIDLDAETCGAQDYRPTTFFASNSIRFREGVSSVPATAAVPSFRSLGSPTTPALVAS